jgi:asparagine synthase (glutamine-hydrolysing)
MADTIVASSPLSNPHVHTISYYDDTEPDWNERPYINKVEERRGHTGCHIDLSAHENVLLEYETSSSATTPSAGGRLSNSDRQASQYLTGLRARVLLSGTGGDEIMGGVPTPIPELEDLLVTGAFRTLTRQLKLWALDKRKPWFQLLFDATRPFFPNARHGVSRFKWSAPWFTPQFLNQNQIALQGYPKRVTLTGPLPSLQQSISALDGLRRQLGCAALSSSPPVEKRYPFLDRDLLEFVNAIPREQLVRPGQRRSLMRRSLVGIVPEEVLNPIAALAADWERVLRSSENMLQATLNVVDQPLFVKCMLAALEGHPTQLATMMRTLAFERWLVHLNRQSALRFPATGESNKRVRSMRVAFGIAASSGSRID